MSGRFILEGLTLEPGDLICTRDGDAGSIVGQFWRVLGTLIPGEVDHVVVYVGPGGRCVEAGARGRVIAFQIPSPAWSYPKMLDQRGICDELVGVAYPLHDFAGSDEERARIRADVASYCLAQAAAGKPYNMNFLDSDTEERFYCSQLAYAAYRRHGIDLNTGRGVAGLPFSESVVFPQEVWESCHHLWPEPGATAPRTP